MVWDTLKQARAIRDRLLSRQFCDVGLVLASAEKQSSQRTTIKMVSSDLPQRPPFDQLPLDKTGPPGNAWGLYGTDDALGALNLLTSEVVAEAAKEIRTGDRVSLDWELNKPSQPSFDRNPFERHIHNKTKPGQPFRHVNDDILHFNTQCSSQWDGFRHFGYQKAGRYYGNRTHKDIETTDVIGIDGMF